MPLVTVITTFYNAEQTIETAVESVLSQTFEDFEYILIDDGSSDGSGKLAIVYGATLVESQNSIMIDETIKQFKESINNNSKKT